MPIKLAVVMDPIQSITPQKDSTLAMLLAAQSRNWHLSYLQIGDLSLKNNIPYGYTRGISVKDDPLSWFILGEERPHALTDFDVILMRKDPPFNMDYIYATYLLELAHARGVLVANDPSSIRDTNEKLGITLFPECTPPTIVTCRPRDITDFVNEHEIAVIKPLDSMGGNSIFQIKKGDVNLNVIIDLLTNGGKRLAMVQRYIPEIIKSGDKRILMIDGEPVPYALARIPKAGDLRGNLVQGANGVGVKLTDRDRWICERVGPTLRQKGLLFVGLDVIGDYLTEVNVTSPTCIRELDKQFELNIAAQLLDAIENKLNKQ